MENLSHRFHAKISTDKADILLAQNLRSLVFRKNKLTKDIDNFDDQCLHILVVDKEKKTSCMRIQNYETRKWRTN